MSQTTHARPTQILVPLADLRLLLQRAAPLLVSAETANDPVVGAIDRLGDKTLTAWRKSQERSQALDEAMKRIGR